MLKQFHPEFLENVAIIHGANPDSAVSLRDDMKLDPSKSKTYGLSKWMKEICPEWEEYDRNEDGSYIIKDGTFEETKEKEIRSKLGISETSNPPSLIIIDEISRFTSYDLDIIDKFA